jgi:hypothetical protein
MVGLYLCLSPFVEAEGLAFSAADRIRLVSLSGLLFLAVHTLFVYSAQSLGEEDVLFHASSSITNYVGSYVRLNAFRSLTAVLLIYLSCLIYFEGNDVFLKYLKVSGTVIFFFWVFIFQTLILLINMTRVQREQLSLPPSQLAMKWVGLFLFIILVAGIFLWMPVAGFLALALFLVSLLVKTNSILFRLFQAHLQRNLKLSVSGIFIFLAVLSLFYVHSEDPQSPLVYGMRKQYQSLAVDSQSVANLDQIQTPVQWLNWWEGTPHPIPSETLRESLELLEKICPTSRIDQFLGAICYDKDLDQVKTVQVKLAESEDKYLKLLNSASKYSQILALMSYQLLPAERKFKSVEMKIQDLRGTSPASARLIEQAHSLKSEFLEQGFQIWIFPAAQ